MRNYLVLHKEELVRQVAKRCHMTMADTRKFYDTFESVIFENLKNTTKSDDMVIKVFDGLKLESKYHEEKVMVHPTTHEEIVVPEKIWAKAKVSRHYNRKLNE